MRESTHQFPAVHPTSGLLAAVLATGLPIGTEMRADPALRTAAEQQLTHLEESNVVFPPHTVFAARAHVRAAASLVPGNMGWCFLCVDRGVHACARECMDKCAWRAS